MGNEGSSLGGDLNEFKSISNCALFVASGRVRVRAVYGPSARGAGAFSGVALVRDASGRRYALSCARGRAHFVPRVRIRQLRVRGPRSRRASASAER